MPLFLALRLSCPFRQNVRREVNELARRLQVAVEERGRKRVLDMQAIFHDLVSRYGQSDFEGHDQAAESIRHADYFAE
jgi:hypothetical protein